MAYKAFMSYSHAADGKLAPALQSAAQRFGKPWYRLRAVRIFRDRTNLAVTPALWPAIEEALAVSEYFVLLASPQAAASPWVEREIAYWVANCSADTILLVLTEGELVWDGSTGDFDSERTTALPPALRGRFQVEPLYIDLRWAQREEDLTLGNLRFRDAVAELAATLQGKSKDSLVGEDVRQRSKALRLAGAAVVSLTVLASLTTWQTLVAREQSRVAEQRQREAESARGTAVASGREAERQRKIAVEQTHAAESQRQIATERQRQAED
jgi:MTH538 TIR-like domain (DUF1863)